MEIVFVKGLERFREIRKIEDLMKFKNLNLKLIINRWTPISFFYPFFKPLIWHRKFDVNVHKAMYLSPFKPTVIHPDVV